MLIYKYSKYYLLGLFANLSTAPALKSFLSSSNVSSNSPLINPSIFSYLNENRQLLKEALSETSSYMTSLANQERRDLEKNIKIPFENLP